MLIIEVNIKLLIIYEAVKIYYFLYITIIQIKINLLLLTYDYLRKFKYKLIHNINQIFVAIYDGGDIQIIVFDGDTIIQ